MFDPDFYLSYYPDLIQNGIVTRWQAKSHWLKHGRSEGRLGSLSDPAFLELKKLSSESIIRQSNADKLLLNEPRINILTRTNNRQSSFMRLRESIVSQTYQNIRHLVSVQNDASKLYVRAAGVPDDDIVVCSPQSKSSHFYNLFINDLLGKVTDGWIFFIDDDDYLASPHSVSFIAPFLVDTDKLVYWKTWFPDKIIPSIENPYQIRFGGITSCCFAFHASQIPLALWDDNRGADYRCFRSLLNALKPIFIKEIICCAPGPGGGLYDRVSLWHKFVYAIKPFINYALRKANLMQYSVPIDFDWRLYITSPDLKRNGVHSKQQAWHHWLHYGQYENRLYDRPDFLLNLSPVRHYANNSNVAYLVDFCIGTDQSGYSVKSHKTLLALSGSGNYNIFPVVKPSNSKSSDIFVVDEICYTRLANPNELPLNSREFIYSYAQELLSFCIKHSIGIITVCSNYINARVAIQVARCLGIKIVYEVRGFWEISASSNDTDFAHSSFFKIATEQETVACQECDIVLAINGGIKNELIRRGIPAGKIRILPFQGYEPRLLELNDFQYNAIPKGAGDIVFGYFGNVNYYEGLDDLIQAFGAVKLMKQHNFKLLLVLKCKSTDHFVKIIKKNDLAEHVSLVKNVAHDQMEQYYKQIDVFCIPRRDVPVCNMVQPMKLGEALSYHKHVLVSSVDALAEIVSIGHNGFVYEKGSIDSLIYVIMSIMKDKESLNTFTVPNNYKQNFIQEYFDVWGSL